jgi:geranylgeranyl diphosphate synthase type II
MTLTSRIETALGEAVGRVNATCAPPRLAAAMTHAVLPGGARVRPQLCLSVALACGEDKAGVSDAAAAAIELIHCASLVHDDLPCFDDADLRRGRPSVHQAYGEPLAVLAGDALIVMAFEVLARAAQADAVRSAQLTLALARATGMPGGICAGQAWESEAEIDLAAYHRAKTGSLFVAATRMGAIAAGVDPEPWTELGARIGEAFQVADDLHDVLNGEVDLGKPCGQDAAHGRPNAVADLGMTGAIRRLEDILGGAIASIPACPGEAMLCAVVRKQAERLTPVAPARHVA